MAYAAGELVNNSLVLCGGYYSYNTGGGSATSFLTICYKYDNDQEEWVFLVYLATSRFKHASSILPDGSMWITGKYITYNLCFNHLKKIHSQWFNEGKQTTFKKLKSVKQRDINNSGIRLALY